MDVNTELHNFLNKMKGKSVDTKFEKLSVVQQLNAFKFQKPSVMGEPSSFSNSLESDLYKIALQESSSPTPICFMAKASPSQAW
ncbi:hypothetical protein Tco_1394813 [Tanacetum coccineum]